MAKYEIVYLPSVQMEINEAVRYTANVLLNPDAAGRLLDAVDERVELLASGNWKGQSLKNHSSGLFKDIDMNWCNVKNYYLFFRFNDADMHLRIYFLSHRLQGLEHILKEFK